MLDFIGNLAYLDPGTGSYIFQILIASAVGILVGIKAFWLNIKIFFAKMFSKNQEPKDDNGNA